MSAPYEAELSVVITSYNYASYLPRAIESALSQGIENMELVVVDNCSTDDSWGVVSRYAARDARVVPYRNERNLGLVGNHRRGLELARGRRVLFLSADDYLLPGHLGRALAVHRENPDIDLVFTTYYHVDEADNVVRYLGHPGHLRGSYYGGRNEFAGLLTHDCYTCLPTTLFDRSKLIASGGFDPDLLAFDLDLYLRYASAGARMAFLDAPGVCIRVHPLAASGRDNYVATGKQLLEHLVLLERYLTQAHEGLLCDHEHGVARLLQAKINNLAAYPDGAAILSQQRDRIEGITARLNALVQSSEKRPIPSQPLVSVICTVGEDLNEIAAFGRALGAQSYRNYELILTLQSAHDVRPFLRDRFDAPVKIVDHRGALPRAAALNDAARLAGGDIIVYADASVAWTPDHLARTAIALRDARIEAVSAPLDVVTCNSGTRVATFAGFSGGIVAEVAARIGEAVPLPTLAHRRRVFDRAGLFEERLRHLFEIEFVQRLLARGPLGIDDSLATVTQTRTIDEHHPAIDDPNGYLGSLRAIYTAYPVDQTLAAARERHFARLAQELSRLATDPDVLRAQFVPWIARGASPEFSPEPRSGPPRVLVIDDRVPYDELGRGYPRARTVVNTLRDSGYDVTFYPLQMPLDEPPLLAGIPGVDILYGRGRALLAGTLASATGKFDAIWVSRPHNMSDLRSAATLANVPMPPLVYDAEAVYVERDRVRAELEGRSLSLHQYEQALERELTLTDGCAVVTAVSEGERELIAKRFRGPIEVLSFSIAPNPTSRAFSTRSGALFVGAIEADSPNDDALSWFVNNVGLRLPTLPIVHAGVMRSPRLQSAPVRFLGLVPDLVPVYDSARFFIAPTRFAAGLPQKVYEAAAHGLPVIATPLIARQLGWNHEETLLVADTPEEWIDAVTRLQSDEALWHRLRERALAHVRAEVAPDAFAQRVRRAAETALSSRRLARSS